jgi:hypothetical protein
MTLEELAEVAESIEREVERFRALPPAARRKLSAIESGITKLERAGRALALFVATQPAPDHEGLRGPTFVALRGAAELVRSAIDEVAGPQNRKDLN